MQPGAGLRRLVYPREISKGCATPVSFGLMLRARPAAVFALLLVPSTTIAQTPVDSSLARYIAGIRAIDNHAHPMRPVLSGAPADTEFDALPLDGIPAFPIPWRLTLEAPEWAPAARALYGARAGDSGAAGRTALEAGRARALREHGAAFPAWVLDRAGIDIMFANRIALGPGLDPPRFRWVPFDDPLLFPLDTRAEAARTPDTRSLYPKEAALLHRYLGDQGLAAVPPTLDLYVATVVLPTLQRQRERGAIAIKFEVAYLRFLNFADPDSAAARSVYARYAAGGVPTRTEYKTLTDYLFRVVAREAGRLGLALHLHVLETFGGFYDAEGATPGRLEPVFNDSTLRGTTFVMIHGGWPAVGETEAMLGKPNVYTDISMMDQILGAAELAQVLRQWLLRWPDKVLFGTDAFEGGPDQGWEEGAYVAATTARRALGMALTGMLRDGEIDTARARTVARMVLRDNAATLYHLDQH